MQISIKPIGNFGNRLLAYMAALSVGRAFSDVSYNCHLPELGLSFDNELHEKLASIGEGTDIVNDEDALPTAAIVQRILDGNFRDVVFQGFFQRSELYAEPEYYREKLVQRRPLDIAPFADDELVINVRTGDIVGGEVPWYPLVPINFYVKLIENTNLTPVFMGQLDDCHYTRELRAAFPNARMIPSGGSDADFNRLLHAKRICLSVSTFSWLAAWLSSAEEIHYPLLGFLHPFCLPRGKNDLGGIDLTPLGDPRYRYHLLPLLNAEAEAGYLAHTRSLNPSSLAVPESFVGELCAKAKRHYETIDVFWNKLYFRYHTDAAWAISMGLVFSASDHMAQIGERHRYRPREMPPRPSSPNIALNKRATQSSVSQWSIGQTVETDAAGAVDGIIDGKYSFHTAEEDGAWWQVDLGSVAAIEEIRIFNRVEHEFIANRSNRLALALAETESSFCDVLRYEADTPFSGLNGSPLIYRPTMEVKARFVRVTLLKRDYLHLEQVEVFGQFVPAAGV